MTGRNRIPETCSVPSAQRSKVCKCWACHAAATAAKRNKRREASTGEHVCPLCTHRFPTALGLSTHRGRLHKSVVTMRSAA